jgi:protochlorophyllide reductase
MGMKTPTRLRKPFVLSQASLRKAKQESKFGDKKLVVVTGTSSGLGKKTAKALLRTKQYHVIGAVRDLVKMNVVAEVEGFNMEDFTPMHIDLGSFKSVHNFVEELDEFRGDHPIDRLACNSAVYQPTLAYPKWTEDGHEQQLQINFLSHFLLTSKVMPMMEKAEDPRICLIGSVTGNDNTVGGGGVYPIADLKELEGLELGCKKPIAMMDGYNFNGAKAYKDTKLALMMTAVILHERFHHSTGIAFSSIYPGCIAESPLFREKRPWFRKFFPIFMKYITGGFVGEEEAGQRLYQVLHDPRCAKQSGVDWGWNGGVREGRGMEALDKGGQVMGAGGAGGGWDSIFVNDPSGKVLNEDLKMKLFHYATEITKADWPLSYQPKASSSKDLSDSILGALEDVSRMKDSKEFL